MREILNSKYFIVCYLFKNMLLNFILFICPFFVFVFVFFLGLHLWHMEVLRLGVKSYATATSDPSPI